MAFGGVHDGFLVGFMSGCGIAWASACVCLHAWERADLRGLDVVFGILANNDSSTVSNLLLARKRKMGHHQAVEGQPVTSSHARATTLMKNLIEWRTLRLLIGLGDLCGYCERLEVSFVRGLDSTLRVSGMWHIIFDECCWCVCSASGTLLWPRFYTSSQWTMNVTTFRHSTCERFSKRRATYHCSRYTSENYYWIADGHSLWAWITPGKVTIEWRMFSDRGTVLCRIATEMFGMFRVVF